MKGVRQSTKRGVLFAMEVLSKAQVT